MAFFRSERGIGRGEIAESRLEVPFFIAFMLLASAFLFIFYFRTGNQSLTLALAISMLVFGITVVRADFGVYILVLAMLLSPEIETGTPAAGERAISLRYDDILIMVIFVGVMVKLAFEGRLRLWQRNPVNAGILAYFGVCIFSTLLAYERDLGAWDERSALFVTLKMFEYYLIFFLVGHAVRDLHLLRRQMAMFLGVALVVSIYGIYTIQAEPRVSAPFETGGTEPNTLGGYLTLVICVAVGLFTQAPATRNKVLCATIAGTAFLPFLYTLSRASYVALLVGLVTLGIISRRFSILLAVTIVLLTSTLIMPDKVVERVKLTFQEDSGVGVSVAGQAIPLDKSTYERVEIWDKVWFILGVGPEYALFGGGVGWESVMDSQYARVILETGLVGLAAFLFLQFRILKAAREAYRWTEDWYGRGLAYGVFAGTLALIAHSVGTISFLIVRIMEPFWFLVALTCFVRSEAIARHAARVLATRKRAALPPVTTEPSMSGAGKATPSNA